MRRGTECAPNTGYGDGIRDTGYGMSPKYGIRIRDTDAECKGHPTCHVLGWVKSKIQMQNSAYRSCLKHTCIRDFDTDTEGKIYGSYLELAMYERDSVCWKNNRAGCSSTLESKRSFFSRNETYVRKPYAVIIQRSNVAMNYRMFLNNVCS